MGDYLPPRGHDDPSYRRPTEIDDYHKRLARMRGLRGPTVPTTLTRDARAAKRERERDAEEWIARLRARRTAK